MNATFTVLLHAKFEVNALIKEESNPETRVRNDIARAVEEGNFKQAFETLFDFVIHHVDEKFDELDGRVDGLRADIRSI